MSEAMQLLQLLQLLFRTHAPPQTPATAAPRKAHYYMRIAMHYRQMGRILLAMLQQLVAPESRWLDC
jgi:hypothetical protein